MSQHIDPNYVQLTAGMEMTGFVRRYPAAISHSIASSKEVNALTWKPLFLAQSAKNSAWSNRSSGQRTAVFREKASRSLLSSAARCQR